MAGIAPVGYTVLAVALGVLAGTLSRKVLPAMAFTLVGFALLRVLLTVLARPHFQAARELKLPFTDGDPSQSAVLRGAWVLKRGIKNAAGHLVAPNAQIACPRGGPGGPRGPGEGVCGSDLGFGQGSYNWQLYQPGNRYWLFQGIETGLFVAIAAVLLVLAMRQIRRIA
jgi:hypothetical protein